MQMRRKETVPFTDLITMMRLDAKLFLMVTFCCFVGVVVINHVGYRKSKDITQVDMTMRELKEMIRYEIQRSVRKDNRVTSLDELRNEELNKTGSASRSRVRKVSSIHHVAETNKRTYSASKTPPEDRLEYDNKTVAVSTPTSGRRRYIVHLCDNTHACSGWGDRQRGLVAAFLLATVTDRVFVLNMTSPCNIRTFLQPNRYNWTCPNSELTRKSAVTIGGVRSTDYHRVLQTEDINQVYPQDVIYLRSNSDLLNVIKSNPHFKNKIPAWANTNRPRSFKNGWDILMKPTPRISRHVQTLLHGVNLSRDGDLVCAHIRIGKNPSLPNDSPNRNSVKSLDALWRFLKQHVKTASRVFVATDSLEVRKLARLELGENCLDTGGTILHIDRQRKSGEACGGFEMVILEQLILTKCHVLVVSASNFSIRAAFIRGRKDNLFMFRNGTVTPFDMGS